MLFGDSITQGGWSEGGFGQRLSCEFLSTRPIKLVLYNIYTPDVYGRKLDILNRGLAGYNTDWAIPVFEQVGCI